MADDQKTDNDDELDEVAAGLEGEDGENPPAKKKKLLLIIIILLVLAGAGAGLFFSGIIPGGGGGDESETAAAVEKKSYMDMDEFLINLNTPGRNATTFLKMQITLELPTSSAVTIVTDNMPRIRNSFIVYLRELRGHDLQGSPGLRRLKEELLLRINAIVEPEKVTDILFKDFIVQDHF